MNTKRQGDTGLGMAIAYFTSIGWSVSVPLTESQRYDLIVDDGSKLYRVEVKTTRYRIPGGPFALKISTSGGNQSRNGEAKRLSRKDADLLFAYTSEGTMYVIPLWFVDDMANIGLGAIYDDYIVAFGVKPSGNGS